MKKLLPFIFIFISISLLAQKQANVWYFGEEAGLDFKTTPPRALTDGKLNTTEGCSSFSKPDGTLLFYSDGIKVYNNEHELMKYSDGSLANDLKGNPSSTQSGMIIPKPGSTTIYYLFTVGTDFVSNGVNPNPGFNYYTIDFSSNPLGEITEGPVNLAIDPSTGFDLSNAWSEKVTAVKGKNCNEIWVLSFVQNTFYAYKVDTTGVNLSKLVTSEVNFNASDKRGYLQVSPNGEKIAFADYNEGGGTSINGSLVLFDFDNETGKVNPNSSQTLIQRFSNQSPYGVAFSQQSNKLYVSTYNGLFNVFQFDMEKQNIAGSRTQIASRLGFRGALQLGPNGKIYASIPGNTSLDVIENPNEIASNIIYSQNAIDLGGKTASQGLPPFIASLLLSIEITDTTTNQVINNENLQYCIGENKTISPKLVTGSTPPIYQWSFDNGTTTAVFPNPTNSPDLVLTNLTTANNGSYLLTVTFTDDCTTNLEGTFNIEVFEAASAKPNPDPINFCDTDATTPNNFDLPALKDTEILGALASTIFEVLYFDSLAKAEENALNSNLGNPYEANSTGIYPIYARVQHRNAPGACFAITKFVLEVTNEPEPVQPTVYRKCDDTVNGGDTDGFFNSFNLASKDSEILKGLTPVGQYLVSYHTTLNDAQTSATTNAIPKNTPYKNIDKNEQIIYVRVENKDNTNCYTVSDDFNHPTSTFKAFKLIVDKLPEIKANPAEIRQCVNTFDGLSTINLTIAQTNISNNHNNNETFEYFEDQRATQQILNFTSYPVDANTNPPKSVWVKTISEHGCARELTELKLIIGQAADKTYDETFFECDDFLDTDGNDTTGSNNDTDGITTFILDKNKIISNITTNPNIEVFFYETDSDRANSIKTIDIASYRNINTPTISGNKFPIYYKLVNKINNDCLGLGQIYLQITPVPIANPINATNTYELCDDLVDGDATNGIIQDIDLESQTATILGNQNHANYTVTYHLLQAEATSGANPLASPFTNTVAGRQPIYVRIAGNGCAFDRYSFNLVVNSLPIANSINMANILEVCDDNSDGSATNGFVQSINLETQTATILGSQDLTNFTVTYHTTFALAQNGGTNITGLFSNDVNPDRVFVRIINNTTGCVNSTFNFGVQINPEPLANPQNTLSNLSLCDNAADADDTNGFVQNFDLDSQIPNILGDSTVQDEDDFNVTFHLTQAGATSGDNPQSTPFTNTTINEQTIYIRIQNKATGCVNDDLTFQVIVNPLPDFEVTSPQIVCLNNTPLTLFVENPNTVYTYQWSDSNGTVLGTANTQEVSTGGEYTVTATTTDGMCPRSRTITVNESSIASIQNEDVTIDDAIYINGSTTNSITINNDNNNLGVGDYEFALVNEAGITIRNYQEESVFENIEGGIYTIHVRDKNECGAATLTVAVIDFPKFFTPNGDGINDTWTIKGGSSTFFPVNSVYIFNRQGKLITQFNFNATGWNGLYNGNQMPSNDYWFKIRLVDRQGVQHNKDGHFSLLRK